MFGGYSYVGVASGGFTSFPAGFAADADVNLKPWFSVEGDFGYHHATVSGVGVGLFEFLGGPRFTAHHGNTDIFVHGLIGGTNISAGALGASASVTAFTFGGGAGVDIGLKQHLAVRVIQADVLPSVYSGSWVTPIKLSAGIVIRF